MNEIALYIAPGSCSRVPLITLIESGTAFETRIVRFMKEEHKSLEYRRINPKGKVPALIIDGEPLTENVAIITYLNQRFAEERLLPAITTPIEAARQIADLCFCSATLHPLVTRIRLPHFFASPDAAQSVWEKGAYAMREYFQLIEDRLATQPWWYGDAWSVMDAYLNWVFWRVEGAEFPVGDFPRFCDHARRNEARPSYMRAMKIEADATAALESEGLVFKPPSLLGEM